MSASRLLNVYNGGGYKITSSKIFNKTIDFYLRSSTTTIDNNKRGIMTSCNNSAAANDKCITLDNLNPSIKIMEYAVRGPLVIRAAEIEKELEKVIMVLVVSFCDFCDVKK